LGIVVNQQNHRFGKTWIAETPARHQQLAGAQTLDVLGLDREQRRYLRFAFRRSAGDASRCSKQYNRGQRREEADFAKRQDCSALK
jgi:hypothetical protein